MVLHVFFLSAILFFFFFFFQAEDGIRDVAVTGVQTCALPIYRRPRPLRLLQPVSDPPGPGRDAAVQLDRHHAPSGRKDRKSTRLNSSHGYISYAVFCLKKKKGLSSRPQAGVRPNSP